MAGAIFAALVLGPYMLPYSAARKLVGDREPGSVRVYSAGPAHYLAALPSSVIYGSAPPASLGSPEKRLFIGVVPLGLVVIGLWPPLDRRRVAYAIALALAIDGTLGHRGLLYPWLREHVGVFMGLRVPARFGHLVLLGASVLAGFGLARVRRRIPSAHRAAGGVAAWAVGTLVIAEYMMWPMSLVPVQTAPDEVSRWLRSAPPGIVAELPLPRTTADIGHDAVAAYRSTFHWQRILNGYSGFYPSLYVDLWSPAASFPDDASLTALRGHGAAYVVVREAGFGAARFAAIVGLLASRCDVTGAGPFPDGSSAAMIYTFVPGAEGCGAAPRNLSVPPDSRDNDGRQ